jgi:hypothetical protein
MLNLEEILTTNGLAANFAVCVTRLRREMSRLTSWPSPIWNDVRHWVRCGNSVKVVGLHCRSGSAMSLTVFPMHDGQRVEQIHCKEE